MASDIYRSCVRIMEIDEPYLMVQHPNTRISVVVRKISEDRKCLVNSLPSSFS